MSDSRNYHVIIPAAGSSRRIAHMTTDQPKSLLEVEGQSIITRSLDALDARGIRRVTFVVGYKRDVFMAALGGQYKNLAIEYVVSEAYATTERGWSFYLTRDSWQREKRPVIFMDADNIYDPALLDVILDSDFENVMMVDEGFVAEDREEELVLGGNRVATGLARGLSLDYPDYAGGFVGINRFSAAFMETLYQYMEGFFAEKGPNQAYERVFDEMIRRNKAQINYLHTRDMGWVNVNHEEDYRYACQLVNRFVHTP
jgi:choline kinase